MRTKCRCRAVVARCSPLLVMAVMALFLAGVGWSGAGLITDVSSLDFGTDAVQTSFRLTLISCPSEFDICVVGRPLWLTVTDPCPIHNGFGHSQTVWVTLSDLRCDPHEAGTVQASVSVSGSSDDPNCPFEWIELPVSVTYRQAPDPNAAEMLADLPALPKPLYNACDFDQDTWLDDPNDPNDPMLIDFVRITHTVGLNVFWADKDPNYSYYHNIEYAVKLCKNASDPNYVDPNNCIASLPPSIVLYYGPYALHGWDTDYPNCKGHDCDGCYYDCNDPAHCGDPNYCYDPNNAADCQDCCEIFAQYWLDFQRVKTRLAWANDALDCNIPVSRIFLDTECWSVKDPDDPNNDAWNDAMDHAYDRFYDMCKQVFPNAKVGWYGRVLVDVNEPNQPNPEAYCSLDAKSDDYQTGLWSNDWSWMQAAMRTDHQAMYNHDPNCGPDCDPNVSSPCGCELIPWLTFGEGFVHLNGGWGWQYVGDTVYDPNLSWQMGAWLNDPNSDPNDPNSAWDVPGVVAFGAPQWRAPDFFKHFRAYVQGANGLPLDP